MMQRPGESRNPGLVRRRLLGALVEGRQVYQHPPPSMGEGSRLDRHASHRSTEDADLRYRHRGGRGLEMVEDRLRRRVIDRVDEERAPRCDGMVAGLLAR